MSYGWSRVPARPPVFDWGAAHDLGDGREVGWAPSAAQSL
jgi:hypothetical protein